MNLNGNMRDFLAILIRNLSKPFISVLLNYRVIKDDPYHVGCLPVFVACLVEMKKATGNLYDFLQFTNNLIRER